MRRIGLRELEDLMTKPGHVVALERHDCQFGDAFRPVCIEDDCDYRGPLVNHPRAQAIAEEHRLKSIGSWKAEK